MLSQTQFLQLLAPVVCRAQARGDASTAGFIDRAAGYVLTLLDCKEEVNVSKSQHRLALRRYQWFDQEALCFFEQYPEGVGIEVAGGLSTRFHRLSEQLDWPRFSWRAVNTPSVDDCIGFIFPELDNHMHVACTKPLEDFTKTIHWRQAQPKLIIVGDDKPLLGVKALHTLLLSIQSKLTDETPQVTLLVGCKTVSLSALQENMTGIDGIKEMPNIESRSLLTGLVRQYWPWYKKPVSGYKIVISRIFEA
ncbi:hypothetical protein [Marinagarivorans algicola]|uniref:hypothetical protein n=1 Tax=Marinagarivorans algicola TaxID=1513270 RepID=UPI0006B673EA|nr:hypothetical protein [Marinagarivorans algicola]